MPKKIITVKGIYIFPNQIKTPTKVINCVLNSYIKNEEEIIDKECYFQLIEAGWCYDVLQIIEVT